MIKNISLKCWTALAAGGLVLLGCNPLPGADETAGGATRVRGQVVRGQVVGARSQAAVARPPRVQLWERAQGQGLGSTSAYAPQGSPQPTDAQGRFDFGFEATAGHEYVVRADEGGLGYYTDWALAPAVGGGRRNEGLRLPVYAPVWVRVDLVDAPPPATASGFSSPDLGAAAFRFPTRGTRRWCSGT